MKWIASFALLLALAGGVQAAGSEAQYLEIVGGIIQADSLQEGGHPEAAALKYREAQAALETYKATHPDSSDLPVDFRLEYLAGKLKELAQYLPGSTDAPVATASVTPQQQVAALQAQIDSLMAANQQLQQKVKEALSIQPAAIAPAELAKAQEKIAKLEKDHDLLVVALAQQKAAPPAPSKAASGKLADELAAAKKQAGKEAVAANAEIAAIKHQMELSNQKLADATAELRALKAKPSSTGEDVQSLTSEKNKLTEELTALQTQSSKDAKASKAQIADLQHQMEESKKMLAASNAEVSALKARPTTDNAKALASEKDRLGSELAALEIQSSKDARAARSQIDDLQRQMDATKQMLAASTAEVSALKSRPSTDDVKAVASERDKLADELAAQKSQSAKDAKAAKAQIDDLQRQRDETKKMLADATEQLNSSKSRPSTGDVNALTIERDKLKKDLMEKSRELADREAHAAAVSQPAPNPGTGDSAALAAENKGLRAQLAVLEAAPIPLTAQEMAVLSAAPATPATAPTAAPAPALKPVSSMEITHKAHTLRDLPQGAGGLMSEGLRSAADGDYAAAEKKFLEVLAQDPDNVYVLVNLGDAQFAEGHLDDCEKNVQRALTLDPNDPGALYLLGILRYRQDKLDDALDALSRSASVNSTNSSTQNYLGCVLFAKGLPTKAETALRKALEIDPTYADAHYNLALVYAKEQPPSLALAKWHYQRAVGLGHVKNSELEKILAGQ